MSSPINILAFAGSARKSSINKLLVNAAARVAAEKGALVTTIDLADFPAPVYNGDDEEANGIPESMRELKRLFANHDAFIVSTPEYNGGITPLLVNTFSWASRPEGGEPPKSVFIGKPVAIMAASPGRLGGVRSISRLRDSLADLNCMPIPGFVSVANANDAFDERGMLKSERTLRQLSDLIASLIDIAK